MRVFKKIVAVIFFGLFLIFSLSALRAYYYGDIVHNVFFDFENEIIQFPSITLCPSLEMNTLVNLKLNEIQKDFNMSFKSLESFMIFSNLKRSKNLTLITEKYSFPLTDMVNIQYGNNENGHLRVDYNRLL